MDWLLILATVTAVAYLVLKEPVSTVAGRWRSK